jgi:hypothetical protein
MQPQSSRGSATGGVCYECPEGTDGTVTQATCGYFTERIVLSQAKVVNELYVCPPGSAGTPTAASPFCKAN